MTWVAADGLRPAGWWDGDPWRDPAPVGPHLRPSEASRLVILAAPGRRTRPEPCERCHGRIVEYADGSATCTQRVSEGGCGWDLVPVTARRE